MLNLSVVQMYPNIASIEHGKVPGLRQKVQELQARLDWCQCNIDIFQRGNCCACFWHPLGPLRRTHDDVCFASLFIIFSFVSVVENGHETCGPWDVQALQRWTFGNCEIKRLRQPSSVAWGDGWPVWEPPRRGGLSICDRCKFDDSHKSIQVYYIYSMSWIWEIRLWLVCYWLGGPSSAHSRSRCSPESSRATSALGGGQLKQSRFEQTRTCRRTFFMSCY